MHTARTGTGAPRYMALPADACSFSCRHETAVNWSYELTVVQLEKFLPDLEYFRAAHHRSAGQWYAVPDFDQWLAFQEGEVRAVQNM